MIDSSRVEASIWLVPSVVSELLTAFVFGLFPVLSVPLKCHRETKSLPCEIEIPSSYLSAGALLSACLQLYFLSSPLVLLPRSLVPVSHLHLPPSHPGLKLLEVSFPPPIHLSLVSQTPSPAIFHKLSPSLLRFVLFFSLFATTKPRPFASCPTPWLQQSPWHQSPMPTTVPDTHSASSPFLNVPLPHSQAIQCTP